MQLYLPNGVPYISSYSFCLISSFIRQLHSSILDLGCGDGIKMEYWRSKGMYVEGGDISEDAKETCELKLLPFKFVDLDDMETPYPWYDLSFDVVTIIQTLEHLKNPKRAVREALRISRDLVIICSPVGESYYSNNHIQFWHTANEFVNALLEDGDKFFIWEVISHPKDVAKTTFIYNKDDEVVATKPNGAPVVKANFSVDFFQSNFLLVIFKNVVVGSPFRDSNNRSASLVFGE